MTETRPYPERARERIKSTLIIKKLMAHIEGKGEMSSTQIQAARILLAKTLADRKSTEVQGRIEAISTVRLTDQELMHIAAGGLKQEAIEGEVVPTPKKLKAL